MFVNRSLAFRAGALLLLAAVSCTCSWTARAQTSPALPSLYLDCDNCDAEFLREELNYFDWVRDRYRANYAIAVVERVASNGGVSFTVTLRHMQQPERPSSVRLVSTQADSQPAAVRGLLLDAIQRMLYAVLLGTPHERAFSLVLPKRDDGDFESVTDGWDHWVFTPELLAELEAESNYFFLKLDGKLNIQRITDSSKLRSTTTFSRRTTEYVLEDEHRARGTVDSLAQRLLYAHSLGDHWAIGAIGVASWDIFANLEMHLHGGPVLEWNLFPYREHASQQVRLAYQVGAWYSEYFERTVYRQLDETRPYHALAVIVDLNQAWGSVQGVVQVNSFIDRPEQWRLSCGLSLSVRLVAGLALQLESEFARIEDQVALRARELTDEEIFLETAEFEKSFAVTGTFGFSYTFGSVYNTIVNPRFGRIDLEEEE